MNLSFNSEKSTNIRLEVNAPLKITKKLLGMSKENFQIITMCQLSIHLSRY